MNSEKTRIQVLGDSIPFDKVRKTFFRFVEIYENQKYDSESEQSKNIVAVRFSKNQVSATILIDGSIRESTYERLAKFEGRSSYGLRCFSDVKILDGYLALQISSMEYDPDAV